MMSRRVKICVLIIFTVFLIGCWKNSFALLAISEQTRPLHILQKKALCAKCNDWHPSHPSVIAAPTGLTAVGVALGVTSAPLIVTAAPVLAAIAHLYSKSRRKNTASLSSGGIRFKACFREPWTPLRRTLVSHYSIPSLRHQAIRCRSRTHLYPPDRQHQH